MMLLREGSFEVTILHFYLSNTVLKGSGKGNYSNIHYVKMTAVELLNFSADKFSFSPFLAVVALANVTRAPVSSNPFGSQVQAILQILIILFLL